MKPKKHTKSHKLRKKIGITLVALILIWWFSNYSLTVSKVNVHNPKINDEITIVQLSDLHGESFGKDNNILIRKIERQKPDIILVTGDMYTRSDSVNGGERVLKLMKNLAQKYAVYFVNGEHDNSEEYLKKLNSVGVHVLDYKEEYIKIKNTQLHLYGITNVRYSSTFNLTNAFEKDTENFTILLAHIPHFESFADFGIDLSICGDTHGNIFRLPFVGAVFGENDIFPDIKGNYTKGLYTINNSAMFISSGLGNYPLPIRFCNRPEIAVIKLLPTT